MQPGRLRYVPAAARRQMEQELKPFMNGRWALGVGRWALGTGHWALGTGHWALFAAFPAFVAIKIYAEAYLMIKWPIHFPKTYSPVASSQSPIQYHLPQAGT